MPAGRIEVAAVEPVEVHRVEHVDVDLRRRDEPPRRLGIARRGLERGAQERELEVPVPGAALGMGHGAERVVRGRLDRGQHPRNRGPRARHEHAGRRRIGRGRESPA